MAEYRTGRSFGTEKDFAQKMRQVASGVCKKQQALIEAKTSYSYWIEWIAEGLRTKDNRAQGQVEIAEKLLAVVVLMGAGYKMWFDLPTIPGDKPKIPCILRTTAIENRLTLEAME